MPLETQVDQLLSRWEEARARGERISVDDLCRETPELREEVGRKIRALEAMPAPSAGRSDGDSASPPAAGVDTWEARDEDPASRPPGPKVNGYQILHELGEGGMGVVYKARQLGLNRLVALKMISAGIHASRAQRDALRVEAEAVARFQHPNIVQVYETDEHDGLPYFSMEYVGGGSLAQKLKKEPHPPRQSAELIETLARAMHYAHQRNIVHRDLKPGNVLLTEDGVPKVADFGLVKYLPQGEKEAETHLIRGTPSYMAPEQAAVHSKLIGPRTDVYALGAILYEMLTGRPPFLGTSLVETLDQVRSQEPVRPSDLQPKVPRDLETISLKCLRKEPDKRYNNAEALAGDLRRFLHGEPIQARPVGKPEKVWRWCRRNPALAGALGAAATILLVGAGVATGLAIWAVGEQGRADEKADLAGRKAQEAWDNAALAKTNENLANQRADAALAAVEQFQVANGLRELEAGQFYESLNWFALPLHAEGARTTRAEMYRNRLSNYWRYTQELNANRYTLTQLFPHQGWVRHAAFSPDGHRVVTASEDNTARVWDAATGQPASPPLQHQDVVCHVAFSPDGRRIVTASWDKTARVWDAATGQPAGPPLQHRDRVYRASFSPDGRRIVTASHDQTARVWDAVTGQPAGLRLLHRDRVYRASFSPDGLRIVTASTDSTAQVWDATTGQRIGPRLQHQDQVHHAAFSPDGRRIVTASWDQTARVWDAATGQPVGSSLKHRSEVNHAAFSPDGRCIVTASGDGTAQVWDAATGQPAGPPLRHHGSVVYAAFSADGRRIVTASSDIVAKKGEARVWDAATGQPASPSLRHDGVVTHAEFSPDGRRVVTAGEDKTARVWDATTGQAASPSLRHDGVVTHAEFSPDGRCIVTASGDHTAQVWDAATGQPAGPPLQHRDRVYRASFSPDGRRIVTASADGTAQVWDAATGQPAGLPLRHQHSVWHAAFSPDVAASSRPVMTRPREYGTRSRVSLPAPPFSINTFCGTPRSVPTAAASSPPVGTRPYGYGTQPRVRLPAPRFGIKIG